MRREQNIPQETQGLINLIERQVIITILLLLSAFVYGQKLNPILGGRYSGGLSYQMEHEYFSATGGIQYTPKRGIAIVDFVALKYDFVYDHLQEFSETHNLQIFKLQASKYISQDFAFTYYAGYFDTINNYPLKTKLSWGVGIQYVDDVLITELLYENLAGFPHVSFGINFKLWNLL